MGCGIESTSWKYGMFNEICYLASEEEHLRRPQRSRRESVIPGDTIDSLALYWHLIALAL